MPLKLADDRYTEAVGETDVAIRWFHTVVNLRIPILEKLSHDLIQGADWIRKIEELPSTLQTERGK